MPEDEKAFKTNRSRGEPLATGQGASVPVKFEEVQKQVGVLRACVTIRYVRDE